MLFPAQKLKSSEKDEKWAKDSIDYVISEGNRNMTYDVARMLSNYRLINSQMEEEEFRSICQTLGVNEKTGKKYIHMYNKTPNMLYALKGEELDRPFSWNVSSIIDNVTNQYTRRDEIDFINKIDQVFAQEFSKMNEIIQEEIRAKSQGLEGEDLKRQMEIIEKEVNDKYNKIIDFDSIQNRYKDLQTEKELAVSNLMKIAMNRIDFKFIKNECFQDAAIAGKEYVELLFEEGNVFPVMKQLNPLNVFGHDSPDNPFKHDSDYVGYKEEVTLGQALDTFINELSEDDLKKLRTFSYNGYGQYGTSDTLFHTRGDSNASSWSSRTNAGINRINYHDQVVVDGKYMGIPNSGVSNANIYGPGLYADNRSYRGRYVSVYTVYWKSYRQVYRYKFIDDYGEMSEEIVPENFVIPDNHKKEKYKDSKFGKTKTRIIWYDDEKRYNSLEEIWIPEIWKGIRLNGDIYINVGPLEHAYQSLTNPYKTKLPIYGYTFNSRNSGIMSFVDRIQPWQRLYYSIMGRLIKNLSQDKGVITFLNTLMINDDIGFEKTMAMAEDGNIVPYNPLAYTKGSVGLNNTLKVAEKIDATNSTVVKYYVDLLKFIENQMLEATGMSPQRMAQTSSYTTATDNQRDTMHSMNITEPLFFAHDLLWEKICQGYMEMLVSSVSASSSKIRGMIDDRQYAIIDLNLISLEDEYLFKVSNNIRNHKILEVLKSNVHAFIQNDSAKFSTLLSMLKIDDLNDFEKEIRAFEDRMEKQEQERNESQKQHEKELKQMEIDNREDIQKSALYEMYISEMLKTKRDIEKEHIKGKYMVTSYNMQHDQDADGISNIMENDLKYREFLNKIAKDEADVNREQAKLELEKFRLSEEARKNRAEEKIKMEQIKNQKKPSDNK
jgi:hypothetical protein